MTFSLWAVSVAESAKILAYLVLFILFWRNLVRRRRAGRTGYEIIIPRVMSWFFLVLALSRSADLLLITLVAPDGLPASPELWFFWHLYYRFVFAVWGLVVLAVYWMLAGDWLKRIIRDWINSQIVRRQNQQSTGGVVELTFLMEHHEPMSIVAALMQTPDDKAAEVLKLLGEAVN